MPWQRGRYDLELVKQLSLTRIVNLAGHIRPRQRLPALHVQDYRRGAFAVSRKLITCLGKGKPKRIAWTSFCRHAPSPSVQDPRRLLSACAPRMIILMEMIGASSHKYVRGALARRLVILEEISAVLYSSPINVCIYPPSHQSVNLSICLSYCQSIYLYASVYIHIYICTSTSPITASVQNPIWLSQETSLAAFFRKIGRDVFLRSSKRKGN